MTILIILGNPNIKSFNHAIAVTCKNRLKANGHTVLFHDLYAEKFAPVQYMDDENTARCDEIKLHCTHLTSCDAIIVIHPNWWGQPPAIVKGWMDRVLLPGIAYDFKLNTKGDHIPIGLLKATTGLILSTSNTPNNYENNVLDTLWKDNVLTFCGIENVKRINFGMVKTSNNTQRSNWLLEVMQHINTLFPPHK